MNTEHEPTPKNLEYELYKTRNALHSAVRERKLLESAIETALDLLQIIERSNISHAQKNGAVMLVREFLKERKSEADPNVIPF